MSEQREEKEKPGDKKGEAGDEEMDVDDKKYVEAVEATTATSSTRHGEFNE